MSHLGYVRGSNRDPIRAEPARAGSGVFRVRRPLASLVAVVVLWAVLLTAGAVHGAQDDARFDLKLGATVTVVVDSGESLADVNEDGSVDRLDLELVARELGTSPPSDSRADADANLVVDVGDLALVGRHVRR